jgi:hypothetical protein
MIEGALSDPCSLAKKKISDEKRGNPKMQGPKKERLPMKKRQPQNVRG